jgi:hypothetical protein
MLSPSQGDARAGNLIDPLVPGSCNPSQYFSVRMYFLAEWLLEAVRPGIEIAAGEDRVVEEWVGHMVRFRKPAQVT